MPLLSVVVATRNEEINIERCLTSLRQQAAEALEIIVVDNGSLDQTRALAMPYADKVVNLKEAAPLLAPLNPRGAQLNYGVGIASGEYIFFPDADMTFTPGLLNELCELLTTHDAIYIPETICGKGVFGKIRAFEREFYVGTCVDAVRAVRKSVFLEVGGFDQKTIRFGPDDWDFTRRLLKRESQMTTSTLSLEHHEEWLGPASYVQKKSAYAHTLAPYIEKWGRDDPVVAKQLGVFYRYVGVFFEHGKWKRILRHPFLATGMYGLRVGVGAAYLLNRAKTSVVRNSRPNVD